MSVSRRGYGAKVVHRDGSRSTEPCRSYLLNVSPRYRHPEAAAPREKSERSRQTSDHARDARMLDPPPYPQDSASPRTDSRHHRPLHRSLTQRFPARVRHNDQLFHDFNAGGGCSLAGVTAIHGQRLCRRLQNARRLERSPVHCHIHHQRHGSGHGGRDNCDSTSWRLRATPHNGRQACRDAVNALGYGGRRGREKGCRLLVKDLSGLGRRVSACRPDEVVGSDVKAFTVERTRQ